MDAYREDLAYIHDVGHGDLARVAAARIVEELRAAGLDRGRIVDLGCGSGILASEVMKAGYEVTGIDVSEAMLAIARERAPGADFHVGSFVTCDLPSCVAITAIGEVLNYAFDETNGVDARNDLFRRAHEALVPGGILMFDVATPERALPGAGRASAEGLGWRVTVEREVDE